MKLFLKHVLACTFVVGAQSALAGDMYRCGNSFQDTPCPALKSPAAVKANAKPIKTNVNKTPVALNKPASNVGNDKTVAATSTETKTETKPEAATPATQVAIDADCKQRGEASKKISWMREIGKTIDEQLSTAPDFKTKQLVANVYNHTGSSLQVKNAIERECTQQKEKDKLADKLMIEARRLRGEN
jgi:hypothetical protein